MDTTDYYSQSLNSYDYSTYSSGAPTDAELAAVTGVLGAYLLIVLVVSILSIISMWRIFTKAGKPGWASVVPFYNMYMLLKIVGRPGWWIILLLIPFVNVVVLLIISLDLAKSFGKSTLFGVVGLWFFSIVGYAILAFGKDKYLGPKAS